MRRLFLAAVLISFLFFGCISQETYPKTIAESITSTQSLDLDGDGAADLIIYDYAPVQNDNVTMKRQVAVVVHRGAEYTSFKSIPSINLVEQRARLDSFDSAQKLALQSCAQSAGLKQDCTLISACTVLCSGSSKCKRALDKYPTAVPAAMIDFVNDRNELDKELLDARNMVLNLGTASPEQKNEYLGKLHSAIGKFADVYSNPMFSRAEIALCSRPELSISGLADAAKEIGSYSTFVESYGYYVTVSVSGGDGGAVSGVELADRLPPGFIQSEEDVFSQQRIDVGQNASDYVVKWSSERASEYGYMMEYRFKSSKGPEELAMTSPVLAVNRFDMGLLAVTDLLFNALYVLSGNFFIALGASVSLSVIILMILFNLLTIGYHVARAAVAGEKPVAGLRRALGRTELRWKSDAVLGILLLLAGYYVSAVVATEPSAPLTLLGAIGYFTSLALSVNAAVGLAGVGCVFLGILLIYSAVENKIKITVLEQAYGVVIKEEQDLFQARATRLKEKMKELQRIVEQYSADEFDVSQEYDVLTSLSAQRIEELSKRMTARTKKVIEDDLSKVEGAIERLSERKKMADESWPKWSDMIDKMLSEQNEVYLTSLITIPASLRTWALRRYVKERGAEGMVFERDAIKRRKITPEMLLKALINQKLITVAVVIKEDRVLAADVAQGSATVQSVLALKLRNNLRSLARSLGQHEPASYATVGKKNVLVFMKTADLDSLLLIPREKFKEAIEEFKKKAGMLA